jgi:mRNA interferase RelE/StbE
MRRLTKVIKQRVRNRIRALWEDPYAGAIKLTHLAGFRQRVGDYRILFRVDDKQRLVRVTAVLHRREAYR